MDRSPVFAFDAMVQRLFRTLWCIGARSLSMGIDRFDALPRCLPAAGSRRGYAR